MILANIYSAPKLPCETKQSKNDDNLQKAWEHCKTKSKSIEVFYKNEEEDKKILAKVHFRLYSSVSVHSEIMKCSNIHVCIYLSMLQQDELPDELIEKIKYQVNRDSPEDKNRDFLNWMKAAKKQILHLVCAVVL